MPKLYCISDVHGFYDEMIEALDKAGFDPNNEDHWLISCGDCLDRGSQPQEVIDYLSSLPRCILVKGNHSDLIMDCLNRGFPYGNDMHNGTFRTILDLAPNAKTFESACIIAHEKVKPFVDKMVNYFETENYIFVHSWIPVICDDDLPAYYTRNRKFKFTPDWRYAYNYEWKDARWGNPFDLAANGLNQTGKTIVHGHWGNSHFWAQEKGLSEYGDDACFNICEHNSCIGLDATTALSKRVNVLVLKDEFLEKPIDNH